jgi:hypothetical protein
MNFQVCVRYRTEPRQGPRQLALGLQAFAQRPRGEKDLPMTTPNKRHQQAKPPSDLEDALALLKADHQAVSSLFG